MDGMVSVDEPTCPFDIDEVARLGGQPPSIWNASPSVRTALEKEGVIEVGLGTHVPIVNVYGGEEERLGRGTRKCEGHWVNALLALAELEDGETEPLVIRQLGPDFNGQTEPWIETAEVVDRRH